ncbi:hypothetical protein [Legionella geestiana]|nr:hypothetical protein [Legionella geestiana]
MGNTIDITYLKKIEAELIEAKNAAEVPIPTKWIRNSEGSGSLIPTHLDH